MESSGEQIERFELRIEELREKIGRSRRLVSIGRACATTGPVLLASLLFGVLSFSAVGMIIGITLGIGGVVLMGSSKATTEELEHSLKMIDEKRSAAIDALQLVQRGDRNI